MSRLASCSANWFLQHVGEEIAALAVVRHDEEHLLPFPDLTDVQDVWMVQLAEYLVLPNETSHICDLALMDSLDGDTLLGEPILGLVDDSKATLPSLLLEKVLVLDVALSCLEEQTLLHDHVLVEPSVN